MTAVFPQQAPPSGLYAKLNGYLKHRIPGSYLKLQSLPLVPAISLYLINDDYPRDGLNPELVEALMDNPPYWGFCWGSGQALARWILNNPASVVDSILVDLGCGSGVVGIAAKMAGARTVILCDQDEQALVAARLNALHNAVSVSYSKSLEATIDQLTSTSSPQKTIVAVADVFYDRDNLPLLPVLIENFSTVLVADSRLKGQPLPDMEIFSTVDSRTVPDLDESFEFSRISLYRSIRTV